MQSNTRQFDNFDQFANDYRNIHNENIKLSGADSDYFSEYKVIEVATHESATEALHFLDLGCGDGNSVKFFRKHFPKAKITGIDVSEDSINLAKTRNIENAVFTAYDGAHIPFADNTFDVIFIATVMHHIDHALHVGLMTEARRVLRKGGRLYIFEHNPYNPVTRNVVNNCVFDADAVLLSPPYTKRMLKQAGFQDISNTFTIFFPRSGFFQPFLFLEKFLKKIPLGGQFYTKGFK